MSLIKERKVENIELFYDLIFVYAISKMSGLIHHPHHGIIDMTLFIKFVLCSLVVLQEWLYLTNYLNRFGTFNIREIVVLCINMGAAIYLSNSISSDWSEIYYPFNISMIVMSSSVAFLYHCQAMKKRFGEKESVNARNILLIVVGLLLVSLFISNFKIGIIISIIANLSGVFLPLIYKVEFDPTVSNFAHLKERFELLTILFFGEMIISVTQYFDIKHFSIYPFIAFITIVCLFGTYTILINKTVSHNQITRGLVLMYSHFALLISLSILTSAWNIVGQGADKTFLILYGTLGYLGFYGALFANMIYLKKENRFEKKEYFTLISVIILLHAVMFIFRESFVISELILLVMVLFILYVVAKKYGKIKL